MKKLSEICLPAALAVIFIFSSVTLYGGSKGDLGVGGYLGIGIATGYQDNTDSAFAMGIQPEISYFLLNNVSLNFRFLWERIFYKQDINAPIDATLDLSHNIYPFLLSGRYHIPFKDGLGLFLGGGFGVAVFQGDYVGAGSAESRFMMDFQGGIEYHYKKRVTLNFLFDVALPNVGGRDKDEKTIARFMILIGAIYHVGL